MVTTTVNQKDERQIDIMKRQFEEYIGALNDHDLERALSLLSDDFHLHFSEFDLRLDKKQMVDVLGWDKGVNGEVSYTNLQVATDSIAGLFVEKNDFFNLVGIDHVKAKVMFSFGTSGLIVSQTYTPLPNQPSFQENMQPAVEWAKVQMPDELNAIYKDNQIQFNEKTGARWVVLLREWKKSQSIEQ